MFDNILFGYATFMDCCARKELKVEQLDDLIEAWNNSTSHRDLRECIGLSVEEYEKFAVSGDDILNQFLKKCNQYSSNVEAEQEDERCI